MDTRAEEDERHYRALGDAILVLRGLTGMNQSPRSINANIIAEAERALIDAGIDDVVLPKPGGFLRPGRLWEKNSGGMAIKAMHRRRAEIEERSGLSDPLPAPRVLDAEWCVGPAGKMTALVLVLVGLTSAATVLLRAFRAS